MLVANFGDGTIARYNANTGAIIDFLRDSDGRAISIDGIWGIGIGNEARLGDGNALYFAAGPNNEIDGLFGSIRVDAVPEPAAASAIILFTAYFAARTRRAKI